MDKCLEIFHVEIIHKIFCGGKFLWFRSICKIFLTVDSYMYIIWTSACNSPSVKSTTRLLVLGEAGITGSSC